MTPLKSMSPFKRLQLALKAALQLSPAALWAYAGYQARLRSGWLRRATPIRRDWLQTDTWPLRRLFPLPEKKQLLDVLGDDLQILIAEADEILDGQVRLFGGPPQALVLDPEQGGRHWSAFAHALPDGSDIKRTWEMGRFGWATVLARAYHATGYDKYAAGFWARAERFLTANPPNQGPHWASAQEVALRLIALGFSYTVFARAKASTQRRKSMLAAAVAAHARRIPPTLSYARAQDNNHLLSEALGLSTAAALLPDHEDAQHWAALGQRHFARGIQRQVNKQGAYIQHSANYQRLMLQLALWAQVISRPMEAPLADKVVARAAAATRWLLNLVDPASGQAANLGPNDGAYILPLTVQPFGDYRPVLQAAARAFCGGSAFAGRPWDELALWLGLSDEGKLAADQGQDPIRLQAADSWAYLRATHFSSRPGHADQLHLDLWWRGHNLARDAGSYRYNAPPPWDNALAGTAVHNTLTINGQDQMTRAGRFLWLDWAQARVLEAGAKRAIIEHDGFRRLGLIHRRSVDVKGRQWTVRDEVLGPARPVTARLQWLLPDWPWTLEGGRLQLTSPEGETIALSIKAPDAQFTLVRASERLAGNLDFAPILGWYSPTYDYKEPALSLIAEVSGPAPLEFTSRWELPA